MNSFESGWLTCDKTLNAIGHTCVVISNYAKGIKSNSNILPVQYACFFLWIYGYLHFIGNLFQSPWFVLLLLALSNVVRFFLFKRCQQIILCPWTLWCWSNLASGHCFKWAKSHCDNCWSHWTWLVLIKKCDFK